jgi:hypothetical protein
MINDDEVGVFKLTGTVGNVAVEYRDCGSHRLEVTLNFYWKSEMIEFVNSIKAQLESTANMSDEALKKLRSQLLGDVE